MKIEHVRREVFAEEVAQGAGDAFRLTGQFLIAKAQLGPGELMEERFAARDLAHPVFHLGLRVAVRVFAQA